MSREQAYCLCGAAVDLKISEIVDAPNWIVSAYLPLAIFKMSAVRRTASFDTVHSGSRRYRAADA